MFLHITIHSTMKGYRSMIIVLVAALANVMSTEVEVPTHCPENSTDTMIYLKHEYDCAKFYKCVRGEKTLMVCPDRDGNELHFNPERQICDLPDFKVCNNKWRRPKICPRYSKKCIRIPHQDCDKFYLCDRGRETIIKCAQGLHFNPVTQMCDYPNNVGCDNSCRWTCCPPKGSRTKVLLPHECSCTMYYECVDGDQIKRRCPKGRHFDNRRKSCVPAEEADCIIKSEAPPANTKCLVSVDHPVKLPHQRDCNLYYECVKGETILRKCRTGQSFNPRLGDCDLLENIPCDVSTCCSPKDIERLPVLPCKNDTASEEPKCPAKGTVKLPHARNCSLYYICQDGNKTIHACPSGLRFNSIISQCDWPYAVKCPQEQEPSSRSNTFEDEESSENSKTICFGKCPFPDLKDRTVHLPANDCTMFCKCSNGVAMRCPKGLHYDRKMQTCNWPNVAKCEK